MAKKKSLVLKQVHNFKVNNIRKMKKKKYIDFINEYWEDLCSQQHRERAVGFDGVTTLH